MWTLLFLGLVFWNGYEAIQTYQTDPHAAIVAGAMAGWCALLAVIDAIKEGKRC
jgi:hypothetical protein